MTAHEVTTAIVGWLAGIATCLMTQLASEATRPKSVPTKRSPETESWVEKHNATWAEAHPSPFGSYVARPAGSATVRGCGQCGRAFSATSRQAGLAKAGLKVYCSDKCRKDAHLDRVRRDYRLKRASKKRRASEF